MYEIKLDQFSGPLDKLLELIEEKRLEITAISLATVTADFLEYLQTLAEDAKHPGVIADFVVIASRLLLIKSKVLLPSLELTEEEEEEIKDLEIRLKIYKEYKNASLYIKKLWDENNQSFSRQFFSGLPPVFYPPKDLGIIDLKNAILKIASELQNLIPEKQEIKKAVISVKEKIEELLERFKSKTEHSFKKLVEEKSKIEIIAMFLAILHLLHESFIQVRQENQFSDIIIKKQSDE